jgi:hypothetical protein
MPIVNPIIRAVTVKDPQLYAVKKNGKDRKFTFDIATEQKVITPALEHARILQRRDGEVYVHYVNTDKRLDEWVSESAVKPVAEDAEASSSSHVANGRKRKRNEVIHPKSSSPTRYRSVDFAIDDDDLVETQGEPMTEEDYDIQHHKQITAQRNFDKVNFGHWQIKTWYVVRRSLCPSRFKKPAGTSPRIL